MKIYLATIATLAVTEGLFFGVVALTGTPTHDWMAGMAWVNAFIGATCLLAAVVATVALVTYRWITR